SAAERALYFFCRPLVRCCYRVTALGLENLPSGGFLLLPNHISWVDAIVLQLACPRPIRYVIDEEYYHKPILHSLLRVLGCIPINTHHSHPAVRLATEKIAEGEIVCVFPEGRLERTGTLLRLQRGYELIARHANAQVVPVWLDQLWGSIFSFQGGKFFRKLPKRIPYPVSIAFGKPLENAWGRHRIEPLSSKRISLPKDRHRPARKQRIDGSEPGGDTGRQGACRP